MGKKRTKKLNMVTGYILGIVTAVIVCLAGVAGLTQMILDQRMGEGSIRIGVVMVLMIAVFCGNQIAGRVLTNNGVRASCVVSAVSAILLLIAGLAVEGEFESVGYNLGAIGVACLISCVICHKNASKSRVRKRRSR